MYKNHHFWKSLNSFSEIEGRQTPFVSFPIPLTKGLKLLAGVLIKITFAEIRLSKPVERTTISKKPFLFVGLLNFGMEKLVIGAGVTLSSGNKAGRSRIIQNWRFVTSSLCPGIIQCSPALSHPLRSNPISHSFGRPTMISRSLTFTVESFSAVILKTLFDSSICVGIMTHPIALPLNNIKSSLELIIFAALRWKKSHLSEK
jgi:hypothetical protein